jgi:hypothetical protein
MTGKLTSREAWVRFACSLLETTDLSHPKIADDADKMLIEYLARFPDPPGQESAVLEEDSLAYLAPEDSPELTASSENPIVQES